MKLDIWTDGSAIGENGKCPGGYGAVIINGDMITELSGGYFITTNNRMELLAAIKALEDLPSNTKVKIHSDSSYVINGITKWIHGWKRNNWTSKGGDKIKNRDLWERLYVINRELKTTWVKVKAHCGIEYNERADKLAKSGSNNPTMVDEGHVNN